jgi:hypothetical protein
VIDHGVRLDYRRVTHLIKLVDNQLGWYKIVYTIIIMSVRWLSPLCVPPLVIVSLWSLSVCPLSRMLWKGGVSSEMVARLIAGHLARTARRWVGVWSAGETLTRNSRVWYSAWKIKKDTGSPLLFDRQKGSLAIYHSNLGGKEREREKWPTFMRVLILPFSFHFSLILLLAVFSFCKCSGRVCLSDLRPPCILFSNPIFPLLLLFFLF